MQLATGEFWAIRTGVGNDPLGGWRVPSISMACSYFFLGGYGRMPTNHFKSCGLLYRSNNQVCIVGNHRHTRDICIGLDFRPRIRLEIDCKDCRPSAIRVPAPLVACNRSWDSIGLNENLQLLTNFRLSLTNGEQQSKSFFAWHHLGCAHCFCSFVGGSLLGTCSHRGLEGA